MTDGEMARGSEGIGNMMGLEPTLSGSTYLRANLCTTCSSSEPRLRFLDEDHHCHIYSLNPRERLRRWQGGQGKVVESTGIEPACPKAQLRKLSRYLYATIPNP